MNWWHVMVTGWSAITLAIAGTYGQRTAMFLYSAVIASSLPFFCINIVDLDKKGVYSANRTYANNTPINQGSAPSMSESQYYFRESAVKSSVSSANQLNQLIRIISPWPWLILLGIYGILIAVLAWAIWGKVPTYVTGQSVLMVKEGSIYTSSAPEGSGRVVKFTVTPGDEIKKGQVVAHLEQADLYKQVSVSESHVSELLAKKEELLQFSEKMLGERDQLIIEQNDILHRSISIESQNLANLRELVQIKEASVAKGLETKERLIEALTELHSTQATIEQYRDRLTQNDISRAEYVDRWQQRILELDRKIDDANFDLKILQEKLRVANVVTSPADGVVLGLQTSIGSVVKAGSPVISIASRGEGMDAVAFIPAKDGKRIKPGMSALIAPSTFKREEYGSIKGIVETVSQFPATRNSMIAMLQNIQLVDFLAKSGPPLTVRIRLQEDQGTFSRLAWTSSQGPQQHVTPGSFATARITVRKQSPVSLLIPALRKFSEG